MTGGLRRVRFTWMRFRPRQRLRAISVLTPASWISGAYLNWSIFDECHPAGRTSFSLSCAVVARRRLERGVRLNHPEAAALISDVLATWRGHVMVATSPS